MTGQQPVYPNEDQALSRIAQLQAHGFWPGMVRLPGGYVRLTHDPGAPASPDPGPAPAAVPGANLICPPSDQAEQGGKSATGRRRLTPGPPRSPFRGQI